DKSRVTNYKEEQIDQFGNKTDKVWTNGQYDGNDNLIGYDETSVDSFGNKTSRHWGDAQYAQNPSWKGDSDKSNSKYLMVGYTQTVQDPSGGVSTERWSDAQYNQYGELTYNKTTRTDFLGFVTTTEMSNVQYNQYGQMTSYRQTMTDSFGNLQIMDRTNITYTKIGDQLGYNEKLTDGKGRVIERVRSNIVYNDKRLMIGYFESEITPDKVKSLKDWSSYGDQEGYNERGQLKGFREKIYVGNIEVTKLNSNITYDKMGKQSGSTEDTTTIGKNEFGEVVDGRVIIEISRKDTRVDKEGKIVGYTEVARTRGISGRTNIDPLLGWDGEQNLSRDTTVTRDRNNITLTSYDESTLTEGNDGPEGLRTESFAERKDMVMDGLGRLVSYKEDYTGQKGVPESKVHREVSTISYDLKNQLLGSYEESVDSQGVKTITVLANSIYNSQGQAIGFDRTTVQTDGKETVTTRLERTNISYNAMGDMMRYHDRTTKPDSKTSKKVDEMDWRAIGYNKNGQLSGYTQEYKDAGFAVKMDVTGMKYDKLGRTVEQITTTNKKGTENRTRIVLKDGTPLSSWDLANLLEKPGKSLDQLLKEGTIRSEASEAAVDETSSVLRGKIDYDKLGRMLSYTDTSTNADGTINRNTVGGMNYDKLGRVLGFTNISDYSKVMKSEYQLNGKNLDDAGILDVTSKTGKTLWQLIKEGSITKKESWVESNEKTESVRSGVKYNENGNMVSYTE
ncbi:MAG: hypothetical protein HY610_04930, partial [Elusimicrobia bacterium]|nr:hypothetical protein [Elusimicrobiota bacterium]